ncbi:MAG TPA: tRNA lysidine(34) synthetase TilS [Terriglobales bacterium]|nr:tRNA lysidine(34) synthetase TilS [Terriglobales bacterium]
MHRLAERVLATIRKQELLPAGTRTGVAVSGGADSVGLLRLLLDLRDELGLVLSVVHFNHQLRGSESDADEKFVSELAKNYDLEFHHSSGDVRSYALQQHLSIEAAARELRYEFFHTLIGDTLESIATAHTLDDQSETVLMRLIRGAGTRGLSGIHPRVQVEDADGEVCGEIVRPLLGVRRRDLTDYLQSIGQAWREDSSNLETRHMRNRVRHVLMPVLEREFNPAIAESLAEISELARAEEDFWESEIAGWMGTVVQWVTPEWTNKSALVQIGASQSHDHDIDEDAPLDALLDAPWFLTEHVAVQRRVLKAIGDIAGVPLEFQHIEEMRRFAEEGAVGKYLELPLGWRFEKEAASFAFVQPVPNSDLVEYEYELPIPGRVQVSEAGLSIEASFTAADDCSDHLLDVAQLGNKLTIRNWHPGDRYWPAHTKSPKKVKELLQDRHIIGFRKKRWPVVVHGDQIVWLAGFAVPASWKPTTNAQAVLIRSENLGA